MPFLVRLPLECLPGKDSMKGVGWYFSRRLQAPSFPPLGTWRSPNLPGQSSVSLVRGAQTRPAGSGHK